MASTGADANVAAQGGAGGSGGAGAGFPIGGGAGGGDAARRGPRSPSPGRARSAGGVGATAPVLPDSPTGEQSAEALRERIDALTVRLVGVETTTQGLQRDAQAALATVLTQAQSEFAAQRDSLLTLRADVQAEAASLRAYLEETRQATERLYAGASGEFSTLPAAGPGPGP